MSWALAVSNLRTPTLKIASGKPLAMINMTVRFWISDRSLLSSVWSCAYILYIFASTFAASAAGRPKATICGIEASQSNIFLCSILIEETSSNPASQALAYYNRGNAYAVIGNLKASLADFSKTIELAPGFMLAYVNRGIIYGRLQMYNLAIKDMDKAVELEPTKSDGYLNRGIAFMLVGRVEEAIRDFGQVIILQPGNVVTYKYRGNAYYKLGQIREAVDDFSMALKLDPLDQQSRQMLEFLAN